jgi:hypothetical protein
MNTKFKESIKKMLLYEGKKKKLVTQMINSNQNPIIGTFKTPLPPINNENDLMSSMEDNEEPAKKLAKFEESIDDQVNFLQFYLLNNDAK